MKLGVFTVLLGQKQAHEAFQYLSEMGVETLEIGTGGYPGTAHLDPSVILEDDSKIREYKKMVEGYNLSIAALSVHSNHVHPNKEMARKAHEEFIQTCKLAQKLDVDTVVTFSGCPGDFKGAKYPNWVTCAWPPDFQEILKYQWEEELIPYWTETSKIANSYGIKRIAFEMHPGFCVYNPGTLLKLREAVGETIGANFDPSHLFWQQIKPADAIKALKGSIYHFHAKDTKLDMSNVNVNGVLDATEYSDILNRSWVFRTVGYGHGHSEWNDIISTLRATGYDRTISIEHEDSLMSIKEGLEKSISFLKQVLITEKPNDMWWA